MDDVVTAERPDGTVLEMAGAGVHRCTTGQVILDGIDWRVAAGEHWALLGANGAGKTTLLGLAGALAHPTVGSVRVLGSLLGRVDVRELRGRIGHVSSSKPVPQRETALTIVLTGSGGTVQPLWKHYTPQIRARAAALLDELGCTPLADRPFGVCSGGQRARILLARALMPDPALMLLDEPFNALDLPSREDLIDAIDLLAVTRPRLATVTVTHHLEELPPAIGHALLLRGGRVLAAGPAGAVLTGERLSECFGRPIGVTRHEGRWLARSGTARHRAPLAPQGQPVLD